MLGPSAGSQPHPAVPVTLTFWQETSGEQSSGWGSGPGVGTTPPSVQKGKAVTVPRGHWPQLGSGDRVYTAALQICALLNVHSDILQWAELGQSWVALGPGVAGSHR
jgi:hypothetical protein